MWWILAPVADADRLAIAAMIKVKQVSRITGIAPTTVREWGLELSDVLSDAANPGPAVVRRYSEEDVIKLHTAKVLRAEGMDWESVIEELESGERFLPTKDFGPESAPKKDSALISAVDWERMTKPFKDHVATLEAQLDVAQARLDSERDEAARQSAQAQAQLEAERAARVESEIKLARTAGQLEAIYRRHWWQVWRPERPWA